MKKILFQEGGSTEQSEKLPLNVYRYQNAPAGSRRAARRFDKGLDNQYLNQETGYNPYFNVNEYAQPVIAGLNNNEYDRDYAYALRYGDNDWYETYDADGNLIDYDYGDADPEKLQVMWDNLRAAGRNDFDEQYIDNGDGTYTIRRKTPLIEDKEIILYSPLKNTGEWFRDAAQNTGEWFRDAAQNTGEWFNKKRRDFYKWQHDREVNKRQRKGRNNGRKIIALPCNDEYSGLARRKFRNKK